MVRRAVCARLVAGDKVSSAGNVKTIKMKACIE
jgi:hypothetical protein